MIKTRYQKVWFDNVEVEIGYYECDALEGFVNLLGESITIPSHFVGVKVEVKDEIEPTEIRR